MDFKIRVPFIIFLILITNAYSQDSLEKLTRRVELLEKQNEELLLISSETPPSISSFFHNNFTIGGFFEPSYSVITGPDTKLQTGSYSHILGLNLTSDFSSKFRFVSQFVTGLSAPLTNQHNDPRAPTVSPALGMSRRYGTFNIGSLVAQGYVEYRISPNISVQTGLGYVPFGHYAQLREPVLFKQRNGPQILRTVNLFSPLWMGFNLLIQIPDKNAGINLYSTPSVEQSQKQGGGARFWKSGKDNNYTFGLSTQAGRRNHENYQVAGTDFKMQFSKFEFVIDYANQITRGEDPWSASISPTFYFNEQEILFYVIADYASASLNKTGTLPDPYRKWEYGAGINWLPTSFTRYRVGLMYNDYVGSRATINGQNRDYIGLDLSVGVAF